MRRGTRRISAATPARCGVAMDVPWKKANSLAPPKTLDAMFTPGPVRSGLMRYVNGVGPRLENPAMMSSFSVRISCWVVPSTTAWPLGFMALPSALPTMAAGIVGSGKVPSAPMAVGSPAELLTTNTPAAPALWRCGSWS